VYRTLRALKRSPVNESNINRNRKIIADHEAGHVVVALVAGWYHGQFVEIDPRDLPDLAGVYRSVCRSWELEQPYQRLEIAVGCFLVSTAGWLCFASAGKAGME
jgi:hypothetical protein